MLLYLADCNQENQHTSWLSLQDLGILDVPSKASYHPHQKCHLWRNGYIKFLAIARFVVMDGMSLCCSGNIIDECMRMHLGGIFLQVVHIM